MIRKEWRERSGKDREIFRWTVIAFFIALSVFPSCPVFAGNNLSQSMQLSTVLKTRVPIASVEVKNAYPHDTGAFTQGLFFYQGYFYESTGLNDKSTLVRKEVITGKILQEIRIPPEYFCEGIVLFKNKIYQLTWQNETVLIYDARSFREIRKIKYHGEGWGLTSDGKYLLMSNGSSNITFHDPDSFKVVRKIQVRDGNAEVGKLNELEFIKGEIWANIYMEDLIVRISPKNGRVNGWIDLSALRSYLPMNARVDVINGIAYDAKEDRIFVTGKYWPKVFEIKLSR
ncbi:MAG: glutamine cyclotransferase [Deltaproteobacteria bacterium HGW-Deltaproteobacteria-6]|jgi:glutamine cyclotransferase|nr:MAG: glutamine cyclotransferase [Deltaproteobacteria bacterium HGW-Deltaproteobacteria-6]